MVTIPLVGLAANDPVPGNYVAVNFAQGPASSGQSNYSVVLLANKLSTGTAGVDGYIYGPDTIVPMQSTADAVALFGVGSEAARMVSAFLSVNQVSSLYVAPVSESSGSKATLAIAISGTATSNGTVRVFTPDGPIDTGFVSGDTAAAVGANMVINLNSDQNLPFVASGTATVTLTAKQKGLRGNWLRSSAVVLPGATGITVTPNQQTFFSGGTTADSNAAVLAFLANSGVRYYYQVSAAEDATQFGALASQINTLAAPIPGVRQRCIAGSVDSIGNVITIATGVNGARAEIAWSQNCDIPPAEIAANVAAVYSLEETALGGDYSLNFDGFGLSATTQGFWKVPAPIDGTSPSRTTIKSALNNGVTPIGAVRPGVSYLVKRITTRSLNGAVNDYRIRDSHKVTVCDVFADDLLSRANAQFGGKVIGNDPAQGQKPPGPSVVTPRLFKSMITQLLSEYGNNNLIENVPQTVAAVDVVRESSPSTRLSARIPLDVVDVLDQTATNLNQIG